MSAESDMQNLLAHATANARGLASSANNMVTSAIAALEENNALATPNPHFSPSESGFSMGGTGFYEKEEPTAFPAWPEITLGDPPSTQDIDPIKLKIEGDFPDLNLPSFNYSVRATIPQLRLIMPYISTAFKLPSIPSTEIDFTPQRLGLPEITSPVLSIQQPTLTDIDTEISFDPNVFDENYAKFKQSIFGGTYGLDPLLSSLKVWSDGILSALTPLFLAEISDRMRDKYAPVLKFHAALQTRLQNRLTEQRDFLRTAIADRSGWERPQAAQAAISALAEQFAQSWNAQATSQAYTQTAELALSYFNFCLSLFQRFDQGIQALRLKELEMVLEAHRAAIAYAKQTIAALLAFYEAENFTVQEALIQRAEAKLAVFEAELKLAMTVYEVAKGQLEIEQAKQEQDANLIKQYQADTEKSQLDVQLYASQVSAARSELQVVGFPLDIFMLKVKAFDAEVNAHQAAVNARVAEIEGDEARVKGQLAKVSAFEAEVRSFNGLIAAKQTVSGAQQDRNQSVIAEYEAKVKAVLAPVEKSLLKNQYDLSKYQVLADDALADAKLLLAKASVDMAFADKKQDGILKAYSATLERNQTLLDTELKRLQSIAKVNEGGAQILASMAGGAMSAANGIASVVFEESA